MLLQSSCCPNTSLSGNIKKVGEVCDYSLFTVKQRDSSQGHSVGECLNPSLAKAFLPPYLIRDLVKIRYWRALKEYGVLVDADTGAMGLEQREGKVREPLRNR